MMRSAIDGFSPGPRRQMPHPVSQVVQIKPPILALRKPVDEAEWSAWWRQVNLDATREARPVPSILIAGEKRVYGLSLALKPGAGFFPDPPRAACGLAQILLPSEVVESNGREPPLEGQNYPSPSAGLTTPCTASNSASVAGSCPRRSMIARADVSGEIMRRPSLRLSQNRFSRALTLPYVRERKPAASSPGCDPGFGDPAADPLPRCPVRAEGRRGPADRRCRGVVRPHLAHAPVLCHLRLFGCQCAEPILCRAAGSGAVSPIGGAVCGGDADGRAAGEFLRHRGGCPLAAQGLCAGEA